MHSVPSRLGILALMASAVLVGCDDGKQTGTQVKPSEEQVQSTNNMADFMKKGEAKGSPPKATPVNPYSK